MKDTYAKDRQMEAESEAADSTGQVKTKGAILRTAHVAKGR